MEITLPFLKARLAAHEPWSSAEAGDLRQAAVALLLRESRSGPEVLMIQRAERRGDRWSGQMGFPGGRLEPVDADEERAAVRETWEEIGVRLDACAARVGTLSRIQARSREGLLPMSIQPFVYELLVPVDPGSSVEVVKSVWMPLHFFLERKNRVLMRHPGDASLEFPSYVWRGHTVWGLSLAILDELLFEAAADRV